MRRLALGLAVAGLLCLPAACGPGPTGVVFTLDSSRQVPGDVDGLNLHIEGKGSPKDQRYQLTKPFPQTVAVIVDDGESKITVVITATKGGQPVTQTLVTVGLVQGAIGNDTVHL